MDRKVIRAAEFLFLPENRIFSLLIINMFGLQNLRSQKFLLLVCIIIKFGVQFAVSGHNYELHRDEFLHLDQANHLAWGFQSVPPFTSWTSWIIQMLGNTVFWVKFFPALFGALTLVLVWQIVRTFTDSVYALILASTAFIFSVFLRINLLYQPNSADIFFWTLLLFAFIQYAHSMQTKWLYIAAIAFGVGMLNKYNILFLFAGLVPSLILGGQINIFKNKHLYVAALLSAAIIAPNVWWQYQNNFPVVGHMKELSETQLVNVSRLDFLKEQFMAFFGASILIFSAFIGLILSKHLRPYRFVAITYVITIILFIAFRGKDYYAFGLYPTLMAFGSVFVVRSLATSKKHWLRFIPLAFILIAFYPMMEVALPIKSPSQFYEDFKLQKPFSQHTWEDGIKHPISQDFADMLGWKELAQKTDAVYASLSNKQQILVLADNYGQAGAINYYSKSTGLRAVAASGDYVHWFDLSHPMFTMIKIYTWPHSPDKQISSLFSSVSYMGEITNPYAREYRSRIYLMQGAKRDLREVIVEKLNLASARSPK